MYINICWVCIRCGVFFYWWVVLGCIRRGFNDVISIYILIERFFWVFINFILYFFRIYYLYLC